MDQPTARDGGVIDPAELAALGRRSAEELRRLAADDETGKSLRAAATVLESLALRLADGTSEDETAALRAELRDRLATGDLDAALRAGRRLAEHARRQLPEPDWGLFA